MYSLYRDTNWKTLLSAEAPSFAASLLIAELLFKFHSFTLETAAFLGTWFAVSYLFSLASKAVRVARKPLAEKSNNHG